MNFIVPSEYLLRWGQHKMAPIAGDIVKFIFLKGNRHVLN